MTWREEADEIFTLVNPYAAKLNEKLQRYYGNNSVPSAEKRAKLRKKRKKR